MEIDSEKERSYECVCGIYPAHLVYMSTCRYLAVKTVSIMTITFNEKPQLVNRPPRIVRTSVSMRGMINDVVSCGPTHNLNVAII